MLQFEVKNSFLDPSFTLHIVNVRGVVFVAVSVHFSIFAQERSLVEGVLVRERPRFSDLTLLGVEDVGAARRSPVFLAAEDQDLRLRNGASPEPVLYVVLQTAAPHFHQFPVARLISRALGVQAFEVSHRGFVPAEHVDVALLNSHSSGKVSIAIEFRLSSPAVALNRVHLASFGGVVESGSNCVDELVPNCSEAVTLSRIDHVWKLDEGPISELVSMVARL